jgi:hypothetical protein
MTSFVSELSWVVATTLSNQTTWRTDNTLRETARVLGSTKNLELGFVDEIKKHNTSATVAARAARRASQW